MPGGISYSGYSWSSSFNETMGINLHFNMTFFDPNYSYYRAHGLQLRCLSE
ncbi:hypothetical protein [uncultured Rikenella sp.]|uniref:hypothetical protein n=1 Tax=uncultured Rikenella sp. TaxID=368003 RepID=UPI002626F1E1|nr:hypothetical protein [uncultured Rikenella sp.]